MLPVYEEHAGQDLTDNEEIEDYKSQFLTL